MGVNPTKLNDSPRFAVEGYKIFEVIRSWVLSVFFSALTVIDDTPTTGQDSFSDMLEMYANENKTVFPDYSSMV